MKNIVLFLLVALLLLFGEGVGASFNLPWSTTFNCSEWSAESGPATIDCDGLEGGVDCHCSGGQYELITSDADYPGGAGGKGKRHWRGSADQGQGAGKNDNSCSPNFIFSSAQNEVWIRWYMRYEDGFEWANDSPCEKIIYVSNIPFQVRWTWGKAGFWDGVSHHTTEVNAWTTYIAGPDGKGDDTWHCYEVHLNRATGVGQWWIDGNMILNTTGLQVSGDFDHFSLPVNAMDVVHLGCKWQDVDDISISTTGYVGPINATGSTPPYRSNPQPTGTLSSGTTTANISLTTNIQATCRYSNVSGTNYTEMPFNFTYTNSTNHSTPVSGLENGQTYTFYVRCNSSNGYVNDDDFNITFSVDGHKADLNDDGIINMRELIAYIARWKANDGVSKTEVWEARGIWFTGGLY